MYRGASDVHHAAAAEQRDGAIDKRCVRCVRYARFVAEAEALQYDGRSLDSRLHESCPMNYGMKIGRMVAARAGEWRARQGGCCVG
jgi:hypothetical protein